MQPEDPKQDFTPPSEAPYFSAPVTPELAEIQPPTPEVSPAPVTAAVPPAETTSVEPAETLQPDVQPEPTPSEQLSETEPVQWQAAEYHHHEKNTPWFLVFGIVVVVLIAVAVFVIKSWTFAVLIPVMAVALAVFSRRPPRMMDYVLSSKGLYINDTLHNFSEFKGFGVIHDGDEYSVMLIPVRRFQPSVSVYFPEDAGESIVDMLGVRLPMQPLQLDAFDKIVRALRM